MVEDKILGPRGKEILDYISKNFRNPTVGLHVRPNEYKIWEELKELFKDDKYRIRINPEGGEFILKEILEDCLVFFPIAHHLGLDPIEYMMERKKQIRDVVRDMPSNKWLKENEHIQAKAVSDIDNKLISKVKVSLSK